MYRTIASQAATAATAALYVTGKAGVQTRL